jgi:hypothetical protein
VTPSVQAFCDWLSTTSLSTQLATVAWLIPAIQTIHILSLATLTSAAAMVDLHVLGLLHRGQPLAAVAHRFLPWIWWPLLVLLVTGCTLIVGEPARSLRNPAFVAKMLMLAGVLLLTLVFQRGLRRDARFWEDSSTRRLGGRLVAGASLVLWIGIVFAGRWIAYMDIDAT